MNNKDIVVERLHEYYKNRPIKSLAEAVKSVFTQGLFVYEQYTDWPCKKLFYIKEDFDNTPSKQEIRESHDIFVCFRKALINMLPKKETDIIALYTTYGDLTEFSYFEDVKKDSELNNLLINDCFYISTKYGTLAFEFHKTSDNNRILAGYDTDTKHIILFVRDFPNFVSENITIDNLIYVLRRRDRFIHELAHYIDDINKNLSYKAYGTTREEEIKYLNDPSEFKAEAHRMIYSFGGYLFKNQYNLKDYDLNNDNDIVKLFDYFLVDTNKDHMVVYEKDLSRFRINIAHWYPENKEKFYNALCKAIKDTQIKIDYTESERRTNMIKLLTLEETLLKDNILDVNDVF